ncbi:MAG: right-handed parallel beta-helix repeat-containing protein [Rikenellaceae bacterium]
MKRLLTSAVAVAMALSTLTLSAQVQLDSAMKGADKVPISYEIPKAPNNFVFEKPTYNDKILYTSKSKFNRTIYVDAESGNDTNKGTSEATPIKTLAKLAEMGIDYGDQILLKGGQTHMGTIELINLNKGRAPKTTIHISSYGGRKATIDCKGYPACVWIQNTSNVEVSDLKLTGDGGPADDDFMIRDDEKYPKQRYGVRIQSDKTFENSFVENIVTYNLDIKEVYLMNPVEVSRACRQWDMNDGAGWGWGVFGEVLKGGQGIRNVWVKYINVENVSQMGIRFKGTGGIHGEEQGNPVDIRIENCVVYRAGGPGMQFSRCNQSHMKYCRITESGDRHDNRKWGRGSGMWTWGANYFLLEHNIFEGAQGIADCCGAHIDFNCSNVVIQYCLSRYNCGGFIEVLGHNYNCSYRYNISVNDGWRNLKDPQQKFWGKVGTPGCLVTVNGHNNIKKYVGPYQTYIYNNTIISTKEGNAPYANPNVFNLATSNEGLVVANNIFWFEEPTNAGWSMHRWKDGGAYDAAFDFKISDAQKPNTKEDKKLGFPAIVRPMNKKELEKMELVMTNNIYRLYNSAGTDKFSKVKGALPDGYWDENALGGSPDFANAKGSNPADFVPSNAKLIQQGVKIEKLKSDKTKMGIPFGGLNLSKDFFGNPIEGNIVGAVVPNAKIQNWDAIIK